MARCKMVHETNGYYQELDVETGDWAEVQAYAETMKVEDLRGWGRWKAAYRVADYDGVERTYFVDEK